MHTVIRATVLLIGSVIVFIGGANGVAHAAVANSNSCFHSTVLPSYGPGSGPICAGFTWG
jgi:hypothetical protein